MEVSRCILATEAPKESVPIHNTIRGSIHLHLWLKGWDELPVPSPAFYCYVIKTRSSFVINYNYRYKRHARAGHCQVALLVCLSYYVPFWARLCWSSRATRKHLAVPPRYCMQMHWSPLHVSWWLRATPLWNYKAWTPSTNPWKLSRTFLPTLQCYYHTTYYNSSPVSSTFPS